MKLNQITVSLITVIGSQVLALPAFADRIIQRSSGAFYIVSDREASQAFDRNNFGIFVMPPTVNYPIYKRTGMGTTKKQATKSKPVKAPVDCMPVNCPVVSKKTSTVKPVTTVESAESIFLRLETKK